jgi:lipoprotein NlpI
MHRLGQDDEAARLLARTATAALEGTWTAKLVDYLRGALPAPALLDAAKEDGERTEAHTYIGFDDVRAGRPDAAIKHFRWVKEKGSRNFVEYPIAVAELKRLESSGSK